MKTEGVIILDKPEGPSSARYAYSLRPILHERRVGHAGALDPFASGVLLVCVGSATRIVERLMGLPKIYETTLQLGVTNSSFDTEQPFEAVAGACDPGRDAIAAALAKMVGDIEQMPPRFSAVKIGGRPAYEAARRGEDTHATRPAPRAVHIADLSIRRYAWPELDLSIECGRGTYIRAIARDLGLALGCGACCQTLRRTAVGPFRVEQAVRLDRTAPDAVRAALRPCDEILALLDAVI